MNRIVPYQTNECECVYDYRFLYNNIVGQIGVYSLMIIIVILYIHICTSNQIYQQTLTLIQESNKNITEFKKLLGQLDSSKSGIYININPNLNEEADEDEIDVELEPDEDDLPELVDDDDDDDDDDDEDDDDDDDDEDDDDDDDEDEEDDEDYNPDLSG